MIKSCMLMFDTIPHDCSNVFEMSDRKFCLFTMRVVTIGFLEVLKTTVNTFLMVI